MFPVGPCMVSGQLDRILADKGQLTLFCGFSSLRELIARLAMLS
jgi:hypothetical protein